MEEKISKYNARDRRFLVIDEVEKKPRQRTDDQIDLVLDAAATRQRVTALMKLKIPAKQTFGPLKNHARMSEKLVALRERRPSLCQP